MSHGPNYPTELGQTTLHRWAILLKQLGSVFCTSADAGRFTLHTWGISPASPKNRSSFRRHFEIKSWLFLQLYVCFFNVKLGSRIFGMKLQRNRFDLVYSSVLNAQGGPFCPQLLYVTGKYLWACRYVCMEGLGG